MTWTRFEIGTPNIWFAQLKYDLFVTAPQQLTLLPFKNLVRLFKWMQAEIQ